MHHFEYLTIPTIVCNPQGDIIDCNRKARDLLPINNEENFNVSDIIDFKKTDLDGITSYQNLIEVLQDKHEVHRIITIEHPHPPINYLEIWLGFYTSADGDRTILQLFDASDKVRIRETHYHKEALLSNILENSKEAVLAFDEYGAVELFSSTAERMFGRDSSEMLMEDIYILFHEQSVKEIEVLFEKIKNCNDETEVFVVEDIQCVNASGNTFPVSIIASQSKKLKYPIFFFSISDMTLLKKFINSVNDAYVRTDESGRILDFNNKAETLFGFFRKNLNIQNIKDLNVTHPDNPDIKLNFSDLVEQLQDGVENQDYTVDSCSGEKLYVNLTIWPQEAEKQKMYNAIIRDVTHKKIAEQKLIESAYTDSLTALSNRKFFLKTLNQKIDSYRYGSECLTLMLLDLDHFKIINDTLGHDYGDELLCIVAEKLNSCIRGNDLVSRMGGDEFTIILDNVPSKSRIEDIANRIVESLHKEFSIKGRKVSVTTSIGIANFPVHGKTSDELIKAADMAMYHAKSKGKDTYRYYSETLHQKNDRRNAIEQNLKKALENDEFHLVYQPKFIAPEMKVFGVEALLRWNSVELGFVGPAEFIPIAEEAGLIIEISRWVFRNAIRQFCAWQNKLEIARQYLTTVSLNVSVNHFKADLLSDLTNIISEEKVDPKLLEIEITESALMENIDESIQVLQSISDLGVSISIDDFGTGYSSLQYLKQLPLNVLKIDRTFVSDISSHDHNLFIVEAIISIAKRLKLDIIAEGVENLDEIEKLTTLGCSSFQGFYFSKPLCSEDLIAFIEEKHKKNE